MQNWIKKNLMSILITVGIAADVGSLVFQVAQHVNLPQIKCLSTTQEIQPETKAR